jgi:hypothetical protein
MGSIIRSCSMRNSSTAMNAGTAAAARPHQGEPPWRPWTDPTDHASTDSTSRPRLENSVGSVCSVDTLRRAAAVSSQGVPGHTRPATCPANEMMVRARATTSRSRRSPAAETASSVGASSTSSPRAVTSSREPPANWPLVVAMIGPPPNVMAD